MQHGAQSAAHHCVAKKESKQRSRGTKRKGKLKEAFNDEKENKEGRKEYKQKSEREE
jgi:hypothetical protein